MWKKSIPYCLQTLARNRTGETDSGCVRNAVFTLVCVKNVLWIVADCRPAWLDAYHRFWGKCCFLRQDVHIFCLYIGDSRFNRNLIPFYQTAPCRVTQDTFQNRMKFEPAGGRIGGL